MDYYSAIKRNITFCKIWMDVESIMLSKISKSEEANDCFSFKAYSQIQLFSDQTTIIPIILMHLFLLNISSSQITSIYPAEPTVNATFSLKAFPIFLPNRK